MDDSYLTLEAEARAEIKVLGSRFIGLAVPCEEREAADRYLARMKLELYDATHHCHAFRLGMDRTQFRFNDDGEPSGTAGRPILAAIDRKGLTDLLVVVVRYFGGTKLGTGGLSRAYGGAASAVLSASKPITRYMTQPLLVTFPHSHIGNVMHTVSRSGLQIIDTQYDEDVHLMLSVRLSKLESARTALVNATGGNVRIRVVEGTTDRTPIP